jgi:protein SCO1
MVMRRTCVGFGRGAVVAATVLSVVVMGAACGKDDSASGGGSAGTSQGSDDARSGYTVTPTPSVKDVSLPRADGTGTLAMPAMPGGLRLVYFGYTSCPDVCPTTMSDLRRALAKLPADQRDKVQVAMVSIDPARDTGPRLTDYVHNFFPEGDALRTDDPAALKAATEPFGAQYSVKTNEKGEEEVSHTAEVYAVDDNGDVVMQWPFGTSYKAISNDLASLLKQSAAS